MSSRGLKALLQRIGSALKEIKLRPDETVWEWADRFVKIPHIVGSPFPGPVDTGRTPPLRGLFDLYWDRKTRKFTLCKSARVGGTLIGIIVVLHKIATWPGPIMWCDPTRKTGGRFSRAEMQPFIQECAPVQAKAYKDRERFTTLEMMFKDCTLGIVGTGSAADLGGRQAELLILNERDKMRTQLTDEAPPPKLAEVRTKQFAHTRKILENSTPTHTGGDTWVNFLKGTQHYCYLPCPHCSEGKAPEGWTAPNHKECKLAWSPQSYEPHLKGWQRLTFSSEEVEVPFDENFEPLPIGETRVEKTGRFLFEHCKDEGRWNFERVENETQYECAHCHKPILNSDLNWMTRRYRWVAHNPKAMGTHNLSAHYWAAYSIFERWGSIAKEFLESIGSEGKLQNFWNSFLGLPFVRRAATITASDLELVIKASPEYMLRTLPRRPVILSMCVDVQGDCFWWSIRAWGIMEDTPELETWTALVDYGQAFSWKEIKEYAGIIEGKDGYNEYLFDGEAFRVECGLIDSGFEAQKNKNVYQFCLENRAIFSPSKGASAEQLRNRPVAETPIMDDQITLIRYNDDICKQQLYYNYIKERRGNWWAPRNVGNDWMAQTSAERTREVKLKNGTMKLEWEVVGPQGNHLGDTEKMHTVLEAPIESLLDQRRDEIDVIRERVKALTS